MMIQGRKQRGFSAISVVLLLVVILIGYYVISGFMGSQKTKEIENRVDAIQFRATITKRQCGGGGVDSSKWCSYTVDESLENTMNDLRSAGYLVGSKSSNSARLSGGDPEMTIYLNTSGSSTLLEAKILEGERTI